MTILWLILKIILWLLGIVVSLLLCLLLGVLFLPIEYRMEAEKYETMTYYIKLKIFYLISILYNSETNTSIKILLCGRTIKVVPLSELDENLEGKKEKAEEVIKEEIKRETTKEEVYENRKVQPAQKLQTNEIKMKKAQKSKETEKVQRTKESQEPEKTQKTSKNHKTKKDQDSRSTHINWLEVLKMIWQDENRIPTIRFCKVLLRDLWYTIRPKVCTFNIIFGLEDPAETGMWLAKLMALYPFYAPYGHIMGDFEKSTLEGDIKLAGKTNLYRFIKPLIVFVAHKEVRNYVKLLMKIGKDE